MACDYDIVVTIGGQTGTLNIPSKGTAVAFGMAVAVAVTNSASAPTAVTVKASSP